MSPSKARLAVHAVAASFVAYFAMYAFRKPFSAVSYEGQLFGLDTKTAFVLAQLVGYTLSKYAGVRRLSSLPRTLLRRWLLGAIVLALVPLVGFAVLPPGAQALALFFNGLPLGLIWGLVVRYLEGRRSSELLLAGLSTSFILASGVVKDVGRALVAAGLPPDTMPAAVGLLFLPVYVGAVLWLDRLPPPSAEDEAERARRVPMDTAARRAFVRRFLPGLVLLFSAYLALTAYRDFRDLYGAEIFEGLGYGNEPAIFTATELPVAFGVLLVVGSMALIKSSRRALMVLMTVMSAGIALIAVSTWLLRSDTIDGATWMVATGLGAYLAYVPFGSALFERLVAATRTPGTAVFAIYIADALGYTGSFALQVGRDRLAPSMSRLAFFESFSLAMGMGGACLLVLAAIYFLRVTDEAARRG
ncbi:MAG: DUF5690 family protein [Myxococcota bacterium]